MSLTAKQHFLTMRGSPKTYRGPVYLVELLSYFNLTLLEVLLSSSLALTTVLLFLEPQIDKLPASRKFCDLL